MKRTHIVLLTLLSVPPSLYVLRWHSSAQIGALSHLRGLPDTELRSMIQLLHNLTYIIMSPSGA
jgi:hypothetical protein